MAFNSRFLFLMLDEFFYKQSLVTSRLQQIDTIRKFFAIDLRQGRICAQGQKIIAQVIISFKRPFLSKSCLAGLVMNGQKGLNFVEAYHQS